MADERLRALRSEQGPGAGAIRCRVGEHWQEPVRLLGMAQEYVPSPWSPPWGPGKGGGRFLSAYVRSTCQCTATTMDRWGPWNFKPLMDKLAQNPAQMAEGLELAEIRKQDPQWPDHGEWVSLDGGRTTGMRVDRG